MEKVTVDKLRFFRVEKTYAVKTGKWYFEFEAVTAGEMRVGWARPTCKPDMELGSDGNAFVFNGYKVCNFLENILMLVAQRYLSTCLRQEFWFNFQIQEYLG